MCFNLKMQSKGNESMANTLVHLSTDFTGSEKFEPCMEVKNLNPV
jgi:hypothetical protein